MPGRNFFAYMLLFTMIFDGGMIPKFLVIKQIGLINTLWAVILPMAINVYNLVLMRNFFEGIPESLFEAAQIDGCLQWVSSSRCTSSFKSSSCINWFDVCSKLLE